MSECGHDKAMRAIAACNYGTTVCRSSTPRWECPAWSVCVANPATNDALKLLLRQRDWLARMLSKSPMRYPHLVSIHDISDGTDLWIRAAEEATRDE